MINRQIFINWIHKNDSVTNYPVTSRDHLSKLSMKLLNIFLGALQAQSYRSYDSYDHGNSGRGRPRRPTAASVASNTEQIPSYGPIHAFTRIDSAKKLDDSVYICIFLNFEIILLHTYWQEFSPLHRNARVGNYFKVRKICKWSFQIYFIF